MAANQTKTFILTMNSGQVRRVTVPATWKVTFGPIFMPRKAEGSYDRGNIQYGLRFYEGKDQQRACFTGVESFRDSSITYEEKILHKKAQVAAVKTDRGMRNVEIEATSVEWKNPDTGVNEMVQPFDTNFTKLPQLE